MSFLMEVFGSMRVLEWLYLTLGLLLFGLIWIYYEQLCRMRELGKVYAEAMEENRLLGRRLAALEDVVFDFGIEFYYDNPPQV